MVKNLRVRDDLIKAVSLAPSQIDPVGWQQGSEKHVRVHDEAIRQHTVADIVILHQKLQHVTFLKLLDDKSPDLPGRHVSNPV